ncbi:MAG: bifunctional UDP-N-acetylglucosamine diphosphorylase/glucosamine-1-phosphate N-acetyltransferase GlmU [Wenzhouxiangella sp.]|nr:bifunctional UDP-N-acetylglucosamine diphosphorylase/glucosamine-1-phosphate N-acetyltransferase GlmU [Wenzhouxiangella sp.]
MHEVIILAAGEGKRMNSSRPKVLQPVGGRPMLRHLVETVAAFEPKGIHVVVGFGAGQVEAALAGSGCRFVEQAERLGTGHAAAQALPAISPDARVLILPGDMPLIRAETLQALLQSPADLVVLSFIAGDPTGYGRILRDEQGQVYAIREHRDATEAERAVREVNSGVMCARAGDFAAWLDRVGADNAQGEYYLTDCIALAVADGRSVAAVKALQPDELLGANDRSQLAALETVYQVRARQALFAQGVTLLDPATVQVRALVQAGRDVIIDAGVVLEGDVKLGDDVRLGVGAVLRDCDLAAGTEVKPYSVLEGVRTTGACQLGPFARLRPGTVLAAGVKIGNFVETKNAHFDRGAKASHLSYIGDAEVGSQANIGAGTITCNYDGVNKHRTVIGPEAFIGSNTALVAPVTVGEGGTIGAGSVISQDAPAGQLTVSRARQRSIAGWKRPTRQEK